jgi:hypothetical protein
LDLMELGECTLLQLSIIHHPVVPLHPLVLGDLPEQLNHRTAWEWSPRLALWLLWLSTVRCGQSLSSLLFDSSIGVRAENREWKKRARTRQPASFTVSRQGAA